MSFYLGKQDAVVQLARLNQENDVSPWIPITLSDTDFEMVHPQSDNPPQHTKPDMNSGVIYGVRLAVIMFHRSLNDE